MNAKERFYSGLAKETIGKITSNTDNWTSFLRTMSRNYEFTYPEQVMIYAQRPNATFCKPYEDWNAENYRRYVKRGSTGIALFVMNRDKPYLRYVFDVADTGVRRSSPELKPWEVTPENRSYVMEAMERTFGVAADGVLEAQLEDIASALAAEYWDDYKKQFLDIVANSFLEEYDELNIEVAFKNAVANSVSYTMYCRFVESPDNYFEHEDFQKVFDFNTRQTVNALGTAVNAISTRMFQEIEKAIGEHEQIKATERSTDYERDDLQTGRRLSDSEPSVGERGRETSGQVRQDASSIFGTEQSDAPERHDSDGEPVPAPVGDRGNSESQSGVSDGAVPEGQPRTGQGNAADGVGAAHEQPESTGGGSRDDGAYQQLSLNLFLSENEQISFIDRAESFTPSAFSFAQEEIDHFLLLGSNTDEARKVVALEYMKQKPLEEIVQTLKQVYHGGYGLKEDSGNICAWYAEDGIHLAKGSSAIDSPRAQIVSWETVAERIGELLENGRFATNVELVEASGYERQKLAESLWHLYHDLSEEARSSNYLAILHQEPFRGFPDETADLAEKLDDPRFHATLVQQYSEFRKTLAENPDLLRFHYHKLNLIQKQLYELNMPLREYQTDMMQMPLVRQFITDDEVNADLTRGSGFSGGKARIYNYWQENHSAKEKMDFLKHEYGTGGHSHACSGATHSGQDHDAKGVAYTKSGCDKLQMSWAQVVQRIDGLIRKGRYLSPEEEAERQAIEEAKTDPLEDVYDRFAVIDTEDGEYEQESGTFIPPSAKTVNDLLDEYMSIYGVNTWAMSTYESRKSLIANYIRPLIGDMKLEDVTPRIMDKYYRDLLSVKAVSSKYVKARTEYLTPHTVREVHKTLRNAFNQAVKWELMTRNPVEHATLPKEEHKTRDIWTAEVLQKALEACDDDILRLAINLAFSCSLRMGELLGLTWDCIDISPTSIELGQASIFVEKELQRVNREAMADLDGKDIMFKFPPTFASTHTALVLKTPKTKTSVRKVFLPKTVAEMLVQRKADIEELKDLFGDEFVDFNLVFCSSNGKPIEGQVINRAFNKLIEEKGLPKVVFHSLRHSSITYKLKLNGGDMKSVQGDSGHAQVKMVADVYSHIIDDDRRLNAERMEAAFYSGRQATPEPVQPAATESSADDKELLLKLLQNPEMAALLKSLAKTL